MNDDVTMFMYSHLFQAVTTPLTAPLAFQAVTTPLTSPLAFQAVTTPLAIAAVWLLLQ